MTTTTPRHTLGKNERIKSRKLIESLFRDGKAMNQFPYRVLYTFSDPSAPPLQAGFAVSSRNFKKAVDRNRIKRVTREAYRLQKSSLTELCIERRKALALFFIYTDKALPDFKVVSKKMSHILEQLATVVNADLKKPPTEHS